MSWPNFSGATHYVLMRLKAELPIYLSYHNLFHTQDDILPALERLVKLNSITDNEALMLLRTAALYHDIGFVIQARDHEELGVQIAQTSLPDFGYSRGQIEAISGMIRATKLPQTPHNLLEEIVADADLDVLGRADFFTRNQALRAEMAALGTPTTLQKWCKGQLKFLKSHRYFTPAAQSLRQAQKERHMEQLAILGG